MRLWARLLSCLSALAVLVVIGIKLHELDMPVARFVRSFDIHAVNRVGDFMAIAGRGEVIAGVFLLVWFIGWKLKRDVFKKMSIRVLFATLATAACTQLLKHLIGRPRPRFAHADDIMLGPSLSSGLDAFPSGHAFNAFAGATVVAWYMPALRVPAYMIAGLVGLSRVVRGSHFPTDVFAGAVLGVLVGSLAAVGFKRWLDDALPGLLRTGVPLAVSLFLLVWVVLHPAPVWSLEITHLVAGAGLVLAGGILRGLVVVSVGKQGGLLRTTGSLVLILGVAVASGPWWIALLLLVALMPISLPVRGRDAPAVPPCGPLWNWLPVQGREALVMGTALAAIAAIRSAGGLLPLT